MCNCINVFTQQEKTGIISQIVLSNYLCLLQNFCLTMVDFFLTQIAFQHPVRCGQFNSNRTHKFLSSEPPPPAASIIHIKPPQTLALITICRTFCLTERISHSRLVSFSLLLSVIPPITTPFLLFLSVPLTWIISDVGALPP